MVLRTLEFFENSIRDDKNTTAKLYNNEDEYFIDTLCMVMFICASVDDEELHQQELLSLYSREKYDEFFIKLKEVAELAKNSL